MFRALAPLAQLARLLLPLICGWLLVALPAQAAPLLIDGRDSIEVWPAVSMLSDASHQQTVQDVLARSRDFSAPRGTAGNLGRNADAVWLRMSLRVPGLQAQRRVLELDYPSLNRVEVYVVQQGVVISHHLLGNQLR